MWLVRKVMPECCNAVCKLAMYMDTPGESQWRAMDRIMGYIATQDATLTIYRPKELKVVGFADSNYRVNMDTRQSVTGYVTGIDRSIVNFVSNTRTTVTLSSTEAEYIVASTCTTEIKFITMLLEELAPNEVKRPGTLHEDNTGAIFLMENQAVGQRTKHIDIRYHHIREMIENNWMKVKFIKSEENIADMETKNLPVNLLEKHRETIKTGKMIERLASADREDVRMSTLVSSPGSLVEARACIRHMQDLKT